jgi:transcriptional regulator with XRE-family HTH domain
MKLALKPLLESRGMTQTALAEKIDVSRGYMSLLVNNEREPSAAVLTRLAAALKVSPGELFEAGSAVSQGLEEAVVPYIGRKDASRAFEHMLVRRPRSPMLYEIKIDLLTFGFLRGDVLIADLNGTAQPGDIVVANREEDYGVGSTRLARWADPWLIDADPKAPPSRLDDARPQAIMAVVLGSVRGIAVNRSA